MRFSLSKNTIRVLRHSRFAALALVLAGGAVLQAVVPVAVSANQLASRSIQMSTSLPSATGVSYLVGFTTSASASSLVIDFCSDTPIVGDTGGCAAPSGMVTTGATATSGTGNIGGWTVTTPVANEVKMAAGSAASAGAQTFTLTGITNPSAVATSGNNNAGSFYARITTYSDTGFGTYASPTNVGNFVDYGGVALSTASTINVTAKIMETLSFCVFITSCGDTPSITIGHGANDTLDSSAINSSAVQFALSTNARSGAIVDLKGGTLTSGSNTIAPIGGTTTPVAMTAGTEAYGVQVGGGTGMTVAPLYAGTGTNYGFNTTNTTSTYGDLIASSTAALNDSVSTVTFGATASPVTPAGIYTAAEQLIATGTF